MALGNIIESFFVYLGFEVGTEELEHFSKKVEEAELIAVGLGAALLAAGAGIAFFVNEIAEGIAELDEFAEVQNVNVEALQELGYAASVTDSSLEAVKSTISGLSQKIGEAALGIGRGAMIFKKLHLNAKEANGEVKTASSMFGELASRMQKMSRPEALAFARKLGVDATLVPLMLKGAENLDKLKQEARDFGVVSEENAKQAHELKDAWFKLHFVLRAMGNNIAVKLIPTMRSVSEQLRKWWLANRDIITQGLNKFLGLIVIVLGQLFDYTKTVVGIVIDVVRWFLKWKVVSVGLLAVLSSIVTLGIIEFVGSLGKMVAKLTTKILELSGASNFLAVLMGGIVLLIALLVEDIWDYYHGNDSLIGQLSQKFPHAVYIAEAAVIALTAALIALKWETITGMAESIAIVGLYAAEWIAAAVATTIALLPIIAIIVAIGAVVFAILYLWSHWNRVVSDMKMVMDKVTGAVTAFIDKIKEAVGWVKNLWDGLSNSEILKIGVGLAMGPAGIPILAGVVAAHAGVSGGGVLGGATHTAQSSTTHSTSIQAPITVISPDPARAGESVRKELDKIHKKTIRNGQSAVKL